MIQRPRLPFLALLLPLLLVPAAPLLGQDHPNIEKGFNPERTFQTGDVDHVNLFNGNLLLTVPLGQSYPVGGGLSYRLSLVYNSQLWEFQTRADHHLMTEFTQGRPSRRANAGLGWTVSLGRLFPPESEGNDTLVWVYVSPDGAAHNFYARLHHGDQEDAGDSGEVWDAAQRVQYTRDGSYLRLRLLNTGESDLELPNGEIHRFDPQGWLTQIRTRHVDGNGNPLNWVEIAYQREWDPQARIFRDVQWTISDSHDRSHAVLFRRDLPELPAVVDKVQLQGFAGPSEHTFAYDSETIPRSCPHDERSSVMPPTVDVPFLTGVTQPDGSAYAMPLGDYVTSPPTGLGICASSGAIRGLRLPTLGKLEWTYQKYSFTNADSPKPPRNHTAGVAKRTVKDAAGTELGAWTYTTALTPPASGSQSQELVNTVIDPLGHRTESYFSVFAAPNSIPPGWSPYDYGLPFTRRLTDGPDRFLSSKVFHADGTLLRSTYVRYEMDQRNPPTGNVDRNLNRREVYRKTVYHDDGNTFAEATSSDFDGLGHHRLVTTGGNFGSGDVVSMRTRYNPGVGTYQLGADGMPLPGFTRLSATDPWVLGTYTERQVTEGTPSETSQYCFDSATGFLLRERRLSGAVAGEFDVMTVFTPDDEGNPAKEETFGGDDGGLGLGEICGAALPAAQYRLDHTFAFGVLATSRHFNPATEAALPFLAVDRTIDPTGLVASSRDTAGLQTGYEYDEMGRLTWVKPAVGHGGWTEYDYSAAQSAADLADVTVRRRANGSKSATVLAQSQILFDSLGRVWREQDRLPDLSTSVRETLYDGAGNRASVSEAGSLGKKTVFLEYDPFGRAERVRPPDGLEHDVTFTYLGVRSVAREVKIGTSQSAGVVTETAAKTTEVYDRQGRLRQVTEPSGASGANVTTTYTYDVAGRLTGVSTPAIAAGAAVTQERAFTYDGRGFLLSERHPEKGLSGNGTVSYFDYAARGHARRKQDGPSHLTFVYDPAERLVEVREASGARRPLKTFTYAGNNGTNDRRKGKVVAASRFQYPVVGGGAVPVEVRETYVYGGRDGRVSKRDTLVFVANNNKEAFTQSFDYTPLGLAREADYPVCTHAECTSGVLFADVPAGHWAKSDIERIFSAGITGGCDTEPFRYCPAATVTRAQMAVFLLVAKEGRAYTPPACRVSPFADVPCSYWAAPWIAELVRRGITGGCGGGAYCPENPVTQAQMAVFLLTTRKGTGYTPPACTAAPFADVPCSYWASAWIAEVARRGIRTGCGGGNYCPEALVTRADMAGLLVRTFELPPAISPTFAREVANTYTEGFLTAVGPYATALTYHPNGMLHQIARGNGLMDLQANDPNGQRRPASITTFGGAATRWTTGTYAYDGAGNVTKMGAAGFVYDKVSRLASAHLFLGAAGGGAQVQQAYTFDPFGNLTQIAGSGGRSIPTDSATNRLSSPTVAYDGAGNLTAWNGASYVYDAFHQMERMTSGSEDWYYLYTADDERLWSFNPAGTSRWTLRDLEGKVLREFASQHSAWLVAADYVYRDGQLLAAETRDGQRHFHLDHLGTPRLVTDGAGQTKAYHVYYPFGEEATGVKQDLERMKFTGHERDLASLGGTGDDLDYMHARHYSPVTGRFLSVDTGQSMRGGKAQTWNRYSYGRNNPVTRLDPDGQVDQNFMPLVFPEDMAAQREFDQRVAIGTIAIASVAVPGPEDLAFVGLAGVFKMAPTARGVQIEAALARFAGGGLPRSFPVIDRFQDGVATSVKSIDLAEASYRDASKLSSTLKGFVNKLHAFKGGTLSNVEVRGADITKKVLEVVVPKGVATPGQAKAIQGAVKYGSKMGITVKVIRVN